MIAAIALHIATTRTSSVDRLMTRYVGLVPGASVIVIHRGEIALRRSYGLAEVEREVRVTPKTNFRLASVSKQFTAAAIEQLVERGKLSYDDPITKSLPSLPSYARAITIRHLLTHTSGLIDYEDLIPATATKQIHDDDVLRLIEQTDHTYFAPGTSYRYGNSGYVLLGLIVAKVSGRSFASYLKHEIFEPLSMHDTLAYEEGKSTIANRAYGYAHEKDKFVRRDQSITSATLGDGGIYSSADDLV